MHPWALSPHLFIVNMPRSLLFIILAFFASAVSGQSVRPGFDLSNYGVLVEPDMRLMVVLSTLEMATMKNAAGVEEKLIKTPLSDKGALFREQLLTDNADLNEDLRRRISNFVAQYKKRKPGLTDAEIVSPFISMAYTLSPVPELADPVVTRDLPGNLLDVLDFAPLAREFYRRSSLSSKLDGYARGYLTDSDGMLRSSAREMVSELLDYLHTRPILVFTERVKVAIPQGKSKTRTLEKIETRRHERRFFFVPEKLAAKGNINFLNIRDDYYVIVPPDTDIIFSDARRAFLQFVTDPLVLDNSQEMGAIRVWAMPVLDDLRKMDPNVSPDVFFAVSRSLVAAIDVRQNEYTQTRIATDQARANITRMKTEVEKRAVSAELEEFKRSMTDESALRLYEDYQKGAILAFYFAEQLRGVEDSGFDIASSIRAMITGFDPAKEAGRLAATADARKRAMAERDDRRADPGNRPTIIENPVTTRLLEIQRLIDSKDYNKAETDLQQLLIQHPSEPRIYFTIGRVAGLTAVAIDDEEAQAKKLLEAKTAYADVLRTKTDKTDKALLSHTYVALARIYEYFDEDTTAVELYDQAIKLGDMDGGAHKDAIAAKQNLLKPR